MTGNKKKKIQGKLHFMYYRQIRHDGAYKWPSSRPTKCPHSGQRKQEKTNWQIENREPSKEL